MQESRIVIGHLTIVKSGKTGRGGKHFQNYGETWKIVRNDRL